MPTDDHPPPTSLDPEDWDSFRALGHRLVDSLIDDWRRARDRPTWRPVLDAVRAELADAAAPWHGQGLDAALADFDRLVRPYPTGNTSPRFLGWVHGSGTPQGAYADLLASALNANLGGREHAPNHVERQVIAWFREVFGLPATTSGLLVSGTSMATVLALGAARHRATRGAVAEQGLTNLGACLVGYASAEAHACAAKAFQLLGLGRAALRPVPVDDAFRIRPDRLEAMLADDRAAGLTPFCLVATAGSVNTGAFDDIPALADLAGREGLWLHVDGAFGALVTLTESLRHLARGIERADSLAFDFHKWLHVPYDAGCVLIRDGELHRAAFALPADYLRRETRGLAAGDPWFCDFGIELSRGFRALKVWLAVKEHGLARLGRAIEANCALARHLADRVAATPGLELLAPVSLNIACFRLAPEGLSAEAADRLNADVVADLHESGIAAPSTTRVRGRLAIRVCVCNHRTTAADMDAVLDGVLRLGRERLEARGGGTA
jgi:glutamate/tyrosine decarboxylase-like PLP-dependent enzyme